MQGLLDASTAAFLETGCGMLVGRATEDGEPVATRGWGCTVLENAPDQVRLRVLLSLDDERGHSLARPGDQVAVTATSVSTLRSVQVKGAILAVEPGSADDAARCAAYCEDFFGDIHEIDGTPRELTDRLTPSGVVAWVVEAHEAYDQTPGPGAGLPIPSSGP